MDFTFTADTIMLVILMRRWCF